MSQYEKPLAILVSLLNIQKTVLDLQENKTLNSSQTLDLLYKVDAIRELVKPVIPTEESGANASAKSETAMNQEDISILYTVVNHLEGGPIAAKWTNQDLADAVQVIIDHYGA